jgi:mono/diheme cytochrome c family protein
MSPRTRIALPLMTVACCGFLGACENAMKDMYDQPKYKPLAAGGPWEDGHASRPLEPGVVAYSAGTLAGTSSGRRQRTAVDNRTSALYTASALARGRERFDIYCSPCHGVAGDGNGYITQRGFPHPPTYHSDRLRNLADRYLYDVITQGYGAMYSYGDRVAPEDRWNIVAYIRALQLSQHASLDQVSESQRARLVSQPP